MKDIEQLYSELGGRFISPVEEIRERLSGIRAFVFDWDGVFNAGEKNTSGGSPFSEVDSMGTNLLRFSWYLHHGSLPYTAVLSGENNDTAFHFCKREGFRDSFFKVPHKAEALKFICEKEKLSPREIAYFFDDVLDIPIAERCGLRIQINQKANPLFIRYCREHQLVDYLTAASGGSFAIREATELLIGLSGNFDEVIRSRKDNTDAYRKYIQERKEVRTAFYTLKDSGVEQVNP
jgi:3-deoxy-D-manno-octulosonate 8-phosphate phosphatase (KDO 8-P phosphatase)